MYNQVMSETLVKIMDSAERRIRTEGYNGFSFRDIASDVGVKSSSIHYHFPTKEVLAVAVARRYTDRFFESLKRLSGDPVSRICAAFRKAMESDGQVCLCGALSASGSIPRVVALEAKRFFECAFEYLLAESKTSARISREEHDWALQILALLEGAMMLSSALGDPKSFRSATRSLPPRPHSNRLQRDAEKAAKRPGGSKNTPLEKA